MRPPPARPPPSTPAQQPLVVVGRGNLGRSLARALKAAGRPARLRPARNGVAGLVRSLERAPGAIVFLAVPDDAVPAMAASVAAAASEVPATVAFVHLSGALPLGVLGPLRSTHPVGSFHPLQSFPEPRPPDAFRGSVVAVDASTRSLQRRLASLARSLGARPRTVQDEHRALYHAAGVLASNYVDALFGAAVRLLGAAGWSEKEAVAALLPLTEGTLTSLRKRGPVAALTGPVRRGDVTTVERHLAALAELDRSAAAPRRARLADLYRILGVIALEIAEEAGLGPAAAERMQRALTRKVAATRRRRRV